MKIVDWLIGQAKFLLLYFFVPVTIGGFLVPGYSMIGQQASEITVTHYPTAIAFIDAGALLTGASIIVFALGMVSKFGARAAVSSVLLATFGFSLMSNGIWKMGSPLHGFYGIGFAMILAPIQMAYEFKDRSVDTRFLHASVIVSLITLFYLWTTITGFDPSAYRGLTQRIFAAIAFGWISYAAFTAVKLTRERSPAGN